MRSTPKLSEQLIARTTDLPRQVAPLTVTETGGTCRELSTTLPNGNVLSITNDDADLPGTYIDDPDLYLWVHGPDDTDPITELFTTDLDALVTHITEIVIPENA